MPLLAPLKFPDKTPFSFEAGITGAFLMTVSLFINSKKDKTWTRDEIVEAIDLHLINGDQEQIANQIARWAYMGKLGSIHKPASKEDPC